MLASFLATLVNPYGWRVYQQQLEMAGNTAFQSPAQRGESTAL